MIDPFENPILFDREYPLYSSNPNEEFGSLSLAAASRKVRRPISSDDVNPLRPDPETWAKLRSSVFERDQWHCQLTGCINSNDHLECHHIEQVWCGGGHEMTNLVTLCLFHHAWMPNHNHQSMKERSETERYWIKPSYFRMGHKVRAHFGRRVMVSVEELKKTRNRYQLSCRCGSHDWRGFYHTKLENLTTLCAACESGWKIPLGVREETCVAMTLHHKVHTNNGKLNCSDFDMGMTGVRINAEAVRACPYCFLEDGKCGYLVQKVGLRGRYYHCSNKHNAKINCPYSTNEI